MFWMGGRLRFGCRGWLYWRYGLGFEVGGVW